MSEHLVLRVTAKLLIPFILLFALYVQWHGDYGPGGGFQAGVIFAAAFVLYGMVFGLDTLRDVAPPEVVRVLLAAGVLIYAGTGVVTMLLGGTFTENLRFRSMAFAMAQGYVVGGVVTGGLKTVAGRTRPNGESRSFPSGHVREAFTVATVTGHYYPATRIPGFIVAGLVGVSRMEKNKHFLSDVVAGAVLGYIVGRTVVRGTDSLAPEEGRRWQPFLSFQDGLGVGLQVSW